MNQPDITIQVEAKVIGKRGTMGTPWRVALPPTLLQEAGDATHALQLRHLIAYIVHEEVRAFQIRQEERRLLHVLSSQEINASANTGKITMGGEQGQMQQEVDAGQAVQIALQGFMDGLYLVFIDGRLYKDLDAPVEPHEASTLLFIRLVALVGG